MDTPQKTTFEGLGLSADVLKAVAALGFEEPAPIQAAAIPLMMAGNDIVGQSQTGSGKTAAFAIPAIENTDATNRSVQVLVLCPTRELATQVAEEVHKLAIYKRGIHAVPIYGGASYDRQFYELRKGVQIVIGTPGRVLDHIQRGTLVLSTVRMVVLDEADRMLDMGFRDDIGLILDATPTERQTVFFSATMSPEIRSLIKKYSHDAKPVSIAQKAVTVPTVEQWFYEVQSHRKIEALLRLIDYHDFKLGIIFCNTQRMVDDLADALQAQGFSADRLHGGMAQAQRTRVMNKFKQAEFEFLVATDVAGRGIDIDDLELVVNYDLPYDAEDYVHRIGRTGRIGKRGMAITFVSGREIYRISFIERFTRTRINRGKMPTVGEVEEKRASALLKRVRSVLGGSSFKIQTPLVDRLLEEGFTSTDIAAALFHLASGAGSDNNAAPAKTQAPPKPAAAPAKVDQPAPVKAPAPAKPIAAQPKEQPPVSAAVARAPEHVRSHPTHPKAAPAHVPRPKHDAAKQTPTPRTVSKDPSKLVIPPVPAYAREIPPNKLNRGGPKPAHDRQALQGVSEPMPRLRLAPRGSQWVRLSAGWQSRINPKAIVALLGEALEAPPARVGLIELTETQSFAQVGKERLHKLFKGPISVESEFGTVHLSALPEQTRSNHPAKRT
ncbi:MAG: DEAD/DEAH box helicase [Verrucomicrobia bacterium]|nr:DEAD/DEAH box helicase [Verrucomicrobiota bacterium]